MLTPEVKKKIDKVIKKNPKATQEDIAVAVGVDKSILKNSIVEERHQALLKDAETFSKELLTLDLEDADYVKRNFPRSKVEMMRLKQAEAQFIRESLGKKEGYSKKEDGSSTTIQPIIIIPSGLIEKQKRRLAVKSTPIQ